MKQPGDRGKAFKAETRVQGRVWAYTSPLLNRIYRRRGKRCLGGSSGPFRTVPSFNFRSLLGPTESLDHLSSHSSMGTPACTATITYSLMS